MPEQFFVFTGCSTIQFFNSPPYPNTISKATHDSLQLTVQCLCDLWDAMLLHWSPSTSHLSPCLGKQRISLRVASILNICLC